MATTSAITAPVATDMHRWQGVAAAPPSRLFGAGIVMALLVAVVCIIVATLQPSVNAKFVAMENATSAPFVLAPAWNRHVSGIEDAAGNLLQLHSSDVQAEPDTAFLGYSEFNRFLARQDVLAEVLRSGKVVLHDVQGGALELQTQARHSLWALDWLFWYQLLVGICCWLCGVGIWAFRRHEHAARYSALAGFGFMFATAAAAIYSTRDLALPGAVFRALSGVNHAGAMLTCGAFVAVFWYYPKRMNRFPAGPWLGAGFLSIALFDVLQILPLGNLGVHLAVLAGGCGGGMLAFLQWRRTRGEPMERAALQWFLLSWCLGFGIYLIAVTVPTLAGINAGRMQGIAFGGCLLIAVGLCLGIARYRLYELEAWWFRALAFLLGGALVIATDLVLTALLSFHSAEAMAVSLALCGWLYFPLRQWLMAKWRNYTGRSYSGDMPALLRDVLSRDVGSPDHMLPQALQQMCKPLKIEPLEQKPDHVTIAENGMALQVPGIASTPGWQARWANNGGRLFDQHDVKTMTAVRDVLAHVAAYQHAVQQGIRWERRRLTQDIHDDIGARLVSLLHRYPDTIGPDLRDLLDRLRLTVHGLNAAPMSFADCLDTWRAETAERCNMANVKLEWHQPEVCPDTQPGQVMQVDLTRVLREAISNALKHADPNRVSVSITLQDKQLSVCVINDGVPASDKNKVGLGLRNMHNRTKRLGGTFQLDRVPPIATASWTVPLVPAAPLKWGVSAGPHGSQTLVNMSE